ncbi:Piso0_004874 [Millerozyma farinosa CBS 7064]|uniref:Piso0_004874 protein n=1 Tax=Pichia sorbitophila (strain ATCC MYA-4447 / BCRC 22081 / CBS 7064 / NBRC 10061 / NRRL Y-12695) TaxID=559304 RepID=G8Y3M1_PICSO|nr:Piso0_004874 [Millerozyma farinosa CBS 7064]
MDGSGANYLADLNLVFDSGSQVVDRSTANDLDLFSQSEFFDFDVFNKRENGPLKQEDEGQNVVGGDLFETASVNSSGSGTYSPSAGVTDGALDAIAGEQASFDRQLMLDPSLEERRRKNTAASARFRIKKKLKEQQMEQRTKELREKLLDMEKKIKTLEMENKCLKNLLFQRNEKKNEDLVADILKKSGSSSSAFEFTK